MNNENFMDLDIQLFAENEEDTADTDTTEENNDEDESSTEEDNNTSSNTTQTTTNNKKSFVKIREEKARKQLLKELGVKDIAEAKDKLSKADDALSRIEAIEKQLNAQAEEKVNSVKVNELTNILNAQHVFDADALINYVDLDSIELNNGHISKEDATSIVNSLKELKPNYFGKEFIKTDSYKKNQSNNTQSNEYQADYDAGNYTAVIAKFLKNSKK